MSTTTVATRRQPLRSAGLAWWPLMVILCGVTARATMSSLQLGCSLALLVLTVGAYVRSRSAGLAALFAIWLITPFVRRVLAIDGGYPRADPLSLLPFAATAILIILDLRRGRLSRRARRMLLLAALGYLVGVPMGLLAAPTSMAYAFFTYLIAVGAFVLGYREPFDERRFTLGRVLTLTLPVISIYGIRQYFPPLPQWDATWLQVTNLVTASSPQSGHPRVFSTLNSPATFAMVAGVAMIALLTTRRFDALRILGLVLVAVALALSYVRGAWLGVAIALVALIFAGRGRAARRVGFVLTVLVVTVPVLAAHSTTGSAVLSRVDTFGGLGSDTSAKARIATPSQIVPIAISNPLGVGVGQAGEATKLGASQTLRYSDNAYLALLYQTGPFGFLLVLWSLGAGIRRAWRNVRRTNGNVDLTVFGSIVMLLVGMLTSDLLYGVTGIMLWYLIGVAVRRDEAGVSARPGAKAQVESV